MKGFQRLEPKRVRHLMIERDIPTLADLARRMGMTRQAASKMIQGDKRVQARTVKRLANALGCRPEDIAEVEAIEAVE